VPSNNGTSDSTKSLYSFKDNFYSFLGKDEDDFDGVLATVRSSTLNMGSDASALRSAIDLPSLQRCAAAVRQSLDRGDATPRVREAHATPSHLLLDAIGVR
jgi:hypothetical protein